MLIADKSLTVLQAADRFASEYSEDGPRKVGTIVKRPEPYTIAFQFVGGVRWYVAKPAPNYAGWIVEPE